MERVTRKLPGVERSDVNLTTEKMTIRYDETKVTPEQIVAKVEKAGFGCTPHAEKKEAAEQALQDAEAAELRHKQWERCFPSDCRRCRCRISSPCTPIR